MGYIRHHTIVVTGWHDRFDEVHAALRAMATGAVAVSEIMPAAVNRYRSFFVAPDGSKEGWEESERADAVRAKMVAWLKEHREEYWPAWVEVQFGDDELITRVVADSDEDRRGPTGEPTP